ncbi:MAG: N-acetylmuramoyl-L-alanine amidase [Chloroflexi bacterium]|nr:N-acetylmuramoyl-L-alanine amidase [Chloroflexota bacterium]
MSPDRNWGGYISSIFKADFAFNAVGSKWNIDLSPGAAMELEVRSSIDGNQWSAWMGIKEVPTLDSWFYGDLLVASGRYLQYRLTLAAEAGLAPPKLKEITLIYIDSSSGPTARQIRSKRGPGPMAMGVSRPAVISRAQWGSPEPYSSVNWPPQYRQTVKIILHDTQTRNDDEDPARTVRAIWAYHAITNGWGDIGYNYLIDKYGNVYEGRYGGDNVMGAHALCYNPGSIGISLVGNYFEVEPSAEMMSSLVSLTTWASFQQGIHPLESSYFVERWLPNITTHRDLKGSCGNTHTDPGDYVYDQMPFLRQQVWDRLPTFGQGWGSHNVPAIMRRGETASVQITLQNKGKVTWSTSGSNPFHLGYHWYRADGTQYVQDQTEDRRSGLPTPAAFGQTVTVSALVTAPREAGVYTLRWDMVQEGVTWFANQGNSTLDMTVRVEEVYRADIAGVSFPSQMFAGQRATAWVDLRNTGTVPWFNSGTTPVMLGTANPPGRASGFYTAGDWVSPSRPTVLDQGGIAPGQTGRFSFVITAPSTPGVYEEHFRPIAEGGTWTDALDIAATIRVSSLTIKVDPLSLGFLTTINGRPTPRNIDVRAIDGGAFSWTAEARSPGWLRVAPASGQSPASVAIAVDASGLAVGSYVGEVVVRSVDGSQGSPQVIAVKLVVSQNVYRVYFPSIKKGGAGW